MYNKNIHKLNALSTTEKIGTAEFYNLNIPDDFFPLVRPDLISIFNNFSQSLSKLNGIFFVAPSLEDPKKFHRSLSS